jgi:hypothetical protein
MLILNTTLALAIIMEEAYSRTLRKHRYGIAKSQSKDIQLLNLT